MIGFFIGMVVATILVLSAVIVCKGLELAEADKKPYDDKPRQDRIKNF